MCHLWRCWNPQPPGPRALLMQTLMQTLVQRIRGRNAACYGTEESWVMLLCHVGGLPALLRPENNTPETLCPMSAAQELGCCCSAVRRIRS
jgi:hypothetical protein